MAYKTPGLQSAPPLPSRASNQSSFQVDAPPPAYTEVDSKGPYSSYAGTSTDPRTSSTHSLVPDQARRNEQRTLLLIFIHGFMGNETSFQSFPAHVHNLLTLTLAESHVVHTKIYPRYKSRRAIELAADEFSNWLAPHESPTTDVILLGHSMGGLLSAEILLLPPFPLKAGVAFRHRILGAINFDVPFLGMHPGVISSGIASIFTSKPDEPGPAAKDEGGNDFNSPSTTTVSSQSTAQTSQSSGPVRQDTLSSPPQDPNFNPSFNNDVILPVRKGWRSAMHFYNKHSDGLRQATKQYVKSHVEFGGAMADYPGLKARYAKIRALEDEDGTVRKSATQQACMPPRIRFINYYTASTGRPKKPKSRSRSRTRAKSPSDSRSGSRSRSHSRAVSPPPTGTAMKNTIAPDSSGLSSFPLEASRPDAIGDDGARTLAHINPDPETSADEEETEAAPSDSTPDSDDENTVPLSTVTTDHSLNESSINDVLGPHFHVQMPNLPPIPPPPTEPPAVDLTPYPDKSARKVVQKEHDRQVKLYKQAIKDRDSAIKDRAKLEAKLRKAAAKDMLKQRKKEDEPEDKGKTEAKGKMKEKENRRGDHDLSSPTPAREASEPPREGSALMRNDLTTEVRGNTILSPPLSTEPSDLSLHQTQNSASTSKASTTATEGSKVDKKKRDRVFCMLPSKNAAGERDPTWVRVYMEGVDEVGAHCGLFFVSDTYEKLVGDVSGRVEEWVRDDMTRRFLEENTD